MTANTYEVKQFGTGGHIILPKEYIGRKVKVELVGRKVVFVRRPSSTLKDDSSVRRALWHYYRIKADENLVAKLDDPKNGGSILSPDTLDVVSQALGLDIQFKDN